MAWSYDAYGLRGISYLAQQHDLLSLLPPRERAAQGVVRGSVISD